MATHEAAKFSDPLRQLWFDQMGSSANSENFLLNDTFKYSTKLRCVFKFLPVKYKVPLQISLIFINSKYIPCTWHWINTKQNGFVCCPVKCHRFAESNSQAEMCLKN